MFSCTGLTNTAAIAQPAATAALDSGHGICTDGISLAAAVLGADTPHASLPGSDPDRGGTGGSRKRCLNGSTTVSAATAQGSVASASVMNDPSVSAMQLWAQEMYLPKDLAEQVVQYVLDNHREQYEQYATGCWVALSPALEQLMVLAVRSVTNDVTFMADVDFTDLSDSPSGQVDQSGLGEDTGEATQAVTGAAQAAVDAAQPTAQPTAGVLQRTAGVPQPTAGVLQPTAAVLQPSAAPTQATVGVAQLAGFPHPASGATQPINVSSQPAAGATAAGYATTGTTSPAVQRLSVFARLSTTPAAAQPSAAAASAEAMAVDADPLTASDTVADAMDEDTTSTAAASTATADFNMAEGSAAAATQEVAMADATQAGQGSFQAAFGMIGGTNAAASACAFAPGSVQGAGPVAMPPSAVRVAKAGMTIGVVSSLVSKCSISPHRQHLRLRLPTKKEKRADRLSSKLHSHLKRLEYMESKRAGRVMAAGIGQQQQSPAGSPPATAMPSFHPQPTAAAGAGPSSCAFTASSSFHSQPTPATASGPFSSAFTARPSFHPQPTAATGAGAFPSAFTARSSFHSQPTSAAGSSPAAFAANAGPTFNPRPKSAAGAFSAASSASDPGTAFGPQPTAAAGAFAAAPNHAGSGAATAAGNGRFNPFQQAPTAAMPAQGPGLFRTASGTHVASAHNGGSSPLQHAASSSSSESSDDDAASAGTAQNGAAARPQSAGAIPSRAPARPSMMATTASGLVSQAAAIARRRNAGRAPTGSADQTPAPPFAPGAANPSGAASGSGSGAQQRAGLTRPAAPGCDLATLGRLSLVQQADMYSRAAAQAPTAPGVQGAMQGQNAQHGRPA